jgi:hypothetical protein
MQGRWASRPSDGVRCRCGWPEGQEVAFGSLILLAAMVMATGPEYLHVHLCNLFFPDSVHPLLPPKTVHRSVDRMHVKASRPNRVLLESF